MSRPELYQLCDRYHCPHNTTLFLQVDGPRVVLVRRVHGKPRDEHIHVCSLFLSRYPNSAWIPGDCPLKGHLRRSSGV